MREWYNGYRFAKNAAGDLYNTDMVLHYLKGSVPNKPMPDDLIDPNIRIDYTKLRHLLLVNQRGGARRRGGSTATSTCCATSSARGRRRPTST